MRFLPRVTWQVTTRLAAAAVLLGAAGVLATPGPTAATPPPQPICDLHLLVFGQQYHATVIAKNTTSIVLDDWTFTFTMPVDHVAAFAFNSTLTRDDDQATLHPAVWWPPLGTGASAYVGMGASYPVGSPPPSDFAFHSEAGTVACT